jgi:transcriptional regulator with XRE-family HTH domain
MATAQSSSVMSLFAERTVELMNEKGISVTTLADQANMTRPGLSALLNGRGGNCTLETAGKIADALNIPLHQLLKPNEAIQTDCGAACTFADIETKRTEEELSGKSAGVTELYAEYIHTIRAAIDHAVEKGDSVARIAQRIGVSRGVLNAIRNGTYTSVLNAVSLIAFDLEFDLKITNRPDVECKSNQSDNAQIKGRPLMVHQLP